MSKQGEDVTVALTGTSIDSQTGRLSQNISASLTGEQVSSEQAKFTHTEVVHSEKEKPWFTWLNITVMVIMTIIGALSLGDPVYGSIIGFVIGLLFLVLGIYAKNKRKDVTISSR